MAKCVYGVHCNESKADKKITEVFFKFYLATYESDSNKMKMITEGHARCELHTHTLQAPSTIYHTI